MDKIIVGKIVGHFGIKGQIKILIYNNKPSWIETGAFVGDVPFIVDIYPYKSKANLCVGRAEGASIGDEVWIYREELAEDLVYVADLIGADMIRDHEIIGYLIRVHEISEQNIFECSNGEFFNELQIETIDSKNIVIESVQNVDQSYIPN